LTGGGSGKTSGERGFFFFFPTKDKKKRHPPPPPPPPTHTPKRQKKRDILENQMPTRACILFSKMLCNLLHSVTRPANIVKILAWCLTYAYLH